MNLKFGEMVWRRELSFKQYGDGVSLAVFITIWVICWTFKSGTYIGFYRMAKVKRDRFSLR